MGGPPHGPCSARSPGARSRRPARSPRRCSDTGAGLGTSAVYRVRFLSRERLREDEAWLGETVCSPPEVRGTGDRRVYDADARVTVVARRLPTAVPACGESIPSVESRRGRFACATGRLCAALRVRHLTAANAGEAVGRCP